MSSISISSIVNAPAQVVWDCYTQGPHIMGWNFASDDWHCPSATVDLRVGGTATSRMEAKDGSFGFDFSYTYDEVAPLSRLAFHLEDGRKVVTTFTPVAAGIEVSTIFDPEKQNPAEMQRAGWQSILDNFKVYVESR